jgi:endopeptidase La
MNNEYIINFLQLEYKRIINILNGLSEHINKLHDYQFMEISERNSLLKNTNEISKELNTQYNEKYKSIFNKNFMMNFTNINNKNFADLMKIWLSYPKLKNSNISNNLIEILSFENTKHKIIALIKQVGINKLNNLLNILIGPNYYNFINNKKMLDLINNHFIILNADIESLPKKFEEFEFEYSESNYDMILDRYVCMDINIKEINKKIILEGFFSNDPINIIVKGLQVLNNDLYNKKKELDEVIIASKLSTDKFKETFIKSLTLSDIIVYKKNDVLKKLDRDYDKYLKYSKMTFKNIMNEFNKESENNIINMIQIIRILLLGSDDTINIAGLLYGLTKDKKFSNTTISEIIYKNLPYYLQIKLRKSSINIKNELEKLKSMITDDIDLKKQIIACKNMPGQIKKIALEKIEEMKSGSSEFYKQSQYVNILLNYPWPSDDDNSMFREISKDRQKSREYIERVKKVLDERVYGHKETKQTMQELIGKWISNPSSIGKAIGLVGPPGVGKTLIAKGLGEALGIPFTQINLGGLEDGCVLNGHSYTYSAAQPGLIVRKMCEAGSNRCIIFFDELDKSSAKHGINEIYNVLIHTTDSNTNKNFNDKFFQEVTFPLDKVLFVFSYNDSSKVDKILLDRMEKIEVKPYTMNDKVLITKNFLLKEVMNGIGIEDKSITITDKTIEYLIEYYTFEAGVRELKRKLETILLKLNLDKIYNKEEFNKDNPYEINKEKIEKYLDKGEITVKKIHKEPAIGTINGLYATTNGAGGIIPILIYGNYVGRENDFKLKLTGSQGKVMKESVIFAFTTALKLVTKEERDSFIKEYKYGLHVHTPDGATPKDGPSAGSAFTTAFLSIILGKKIRNDIAMTGEIEMNGRITEIGGLAYKLMGAKKAGIKMVFIPKENEKDYIKIKENNKELINDEFKIKIVDHISEIIDDAFIK